jgi:hypothetical protein
MQTTTLRPGLLVSLKTSVTGNVLYRRRDTEEERTLEDGAKRAAWETERTIRDPAEHDRAVKVRAKVITLIRSCCSQSSFGLLCPEALADKLKALVDEAQALADDFNRSAALTRVGVYLITGRIAPDDVQAVRAINSEIRDLMTAMQVGLQELDVKKIRDAASRAKAIGQMLSAEAAERIQEAVAAARNSAKEIVKAGETAAAEIDQYAIRKVTSARMAFLDLDEAEIEIAKPAAAGRAIDFEPAAQAMPNPPRVPQAALELE